MNLMVTFTHNNQCAEMLAAVRRGPFALPTKLERIEHLLRRKPANASRKDFEKFGCEHVISFQRRMHENKRRFFKRGSPSPLGIVHNCWDRTEAQQRGCLHSHTLVWCKPRLPAGHWVALTHAPRTVSGKGPKQRPPTDKPDLSPSRSDPKQDWEDSIYQFAEVGRISGEMPRADVSGANWGGYDAESLRIAGLARSKLARLGYLHSCTPSYCLKDRCCCRFFFPWPEHPHQVYDQNTQRLALRRSRARSAAMRSCARGLMLGCMFVFVLPLTCLQAPSRGRPVGRIAQLGPRHVQPE